MFGNRCELNRTEWHYITPRAYSFLTEFDLVCDSTSLAAITCASFHIGCLLGGLFSGNISDSYGRKNVMLVAAIFLPFPTFSASFVNAIWQLSVLDFLRGVASSSLCFTGYVYLTELTPPKIRTGSSNMFGLCSSLSFLLVDLVACYTQEWRALCWKMALVILPLWPALYLLPESPRWLLLKGRQNECEAALEKIVSFKNKSNLKLKRLY